MEFLECLKAVQVLDVGPSPNLNEWVDWEDPTLSTDEKGGCCGMTEPNVIGGRNMT